MVRRRGFLASAATIAIAGCSQDQIDGFTNPDTEDQPNDGGNPSNDESDPTDRRDEPTGSDPTSSDGDGTDGTDEPTPTSDGSDSEGDPTTDPTSVSASDFQSPTSVADALFDALIQREFEVANAMAHPDQPGLSGFPLSEEDAPPKGTTVSTTAVSGRDGDIAAVGVYMERPSGRSMTENIGVHTYKDGWLVWRMNNCIDVSC